MLTSAAYFPESLRQKAEREGNFLMEIDGIQVHVIAEPYDHMMAFRQRVRSWIRYYRKARRYMRRKANEGQTYDLIYASSTPLTIAELGRKLSRRFGAPWVFETVDVWPDVPIGMGILKNTVLAGIIQRRTDKLYDDCAAVVALSEGMRDQVLSHGVDPAKVHVIHNGVNPEAFPYLERPAGEKVRVVYTGTVGIANGLSFLVDAAKEIEKRGRSDIEFTILGGGNDLENVKTHAEEVKPGNLRFLARVPKEEVSAVLQSADIGAVVFAPYKVLEANSANKWYDYLSSGLPVVTNYEGWQAAYMRDENCGLSGKQGDLSQFCDNILKLADEPALRAEMGRRGHDLALKKFDRRILAGRLLEIFSEIQS